LGRILVAFDEATFQHEQAFKRIWFPRGEKPRGAFFWSSKKIITFGALTSTNKFHYDFYESQNSLTFKHFLSNYIATLQQTEKYVFILDNAGFHKTNVIREYLERHASWISVEFIPPYSPELNPIETCWKVTKNNITKSQYFPTIEEMQAALETFWTTHKFTQNFITYLCR
jgi:putative transposase